MGAFWHRLLQVHRMESLGHEVVPFEDVVCQMWDMLKLGDRTYVTLQVSPVRGSAAFALRVPHQIACES